jgi:hypothetical protein
MMWAVVAGSLRAVTSTWHSTLPPTFARRGSFARVNGSLLESISCLQLAAKLFRSIHSCLEPACRP